MSNYLEQRRKMKLEGKPPNEKKTHRIKPVTEKRAALNREYAKISRPLWKDQQCAIKAPGCWGKAQGIHHIRGKATKADLLDPTNMVPACNFCNTWVEVNHAEAEGKGFKKSRFKER